MVRNRIKYVVDYTFSVFDKRISVSKGATYQQNTICAIASQLANAHICVGENFYYVCAAYKLHKLNKEGFTKV